jgi:RNA polymerase primary sigma factor
MVLQDNEMFGANSSTNNENKDSDEFEIVNENYQEDGENKEKEVNDFVSNNKNILLQRILNAKVPKREENIELVEKAKNGDSQAIEEVLIRNGKLVLSILKQYYWVTDISEDLLQEGLLGIYKAIQVYDKSYNTAFSTYAVWWIKQSITSYISNYDRNIKLTSHIIDKINKMKKIEQQFISEGKQQPTNKELAELLEMSEQEISELKRYEDHTLSLDLQLGDENNTTIGDLIPNDQDDISEVIMNDMMNEYLQKILEENLNERELDILKMRYGFGTYKIHTLEEIGKKYDITKERVRQIETKIFKKLKHPKVKKQLAECLAGKE